jgi:predicted DsbA family dithiol-disulfide isomerase
MRTTSSIALTIALTITAGAMAQVPTPAASPAPPAPAPQAAPPATPPQGASPATPPAAAPTGKVLATFGGESVTQSEAESLLGPQLVRARQEEFQVLSEGLRDHAFKTLQEHEAARLGITRDELFKRNVTDKVSEPSKEEIDHVLELYRTQLPPDEKEARGQVVNFLKGQRTHAREQAWRSEMLAAASFRLFVEPPRMPVAQEAGDPVWGQASAPVTIVEFSDFQCPYCQRVQPTIKSLKADYDGKVRLVFKQLPLPMHPQARLAAEGALCANAQGKFWELHDWLFANQGGVTEDALKKSATELKLDADAFGRCLGAHSFAKQVDADMALAEKLGIQATPYLLVNGRIVEGAQPLDAFKEIIDDELSHTPTAAAQAPK